MSRAGQGQAGDARDDSGNGGHPAPSVRQGELPVRERRSAARVGGAQLLRAQPDACCDAAPRGGGGGESGDRALPGVEEAPRGGGEHRTGTAGLPAPPGSLSGGSAGRFGRADAIYGSLVGFLSGEEAGALTHDELESRLDVDGRELIRQLYQDHPAPRGALTYPPRSGEGLEVTSLGPMADLDSKGEGDNSMPLNRLSCPGVWGGESVDPRDMAKA